MTGIGVGTQDSVMQSQLKTFKDAVDTKVCSLRDPMQSTRAVVDDIHKSLEFQRSANILKQLAEDDSVPEIHIVISDYGSTLVHTPWLGIMQHKYHKDATMLNKIVRGCFSWTKRNDKIARFIISNRHYSLGPQLSRLQQRNLFNSVFAQDQRFRFLPSLKLFRIKRACGVGKVAQREFPGIKPGLKYLMTHALIKYANKFNTKNKPIRIHVFDDNEEHIQQVLAACIDCSDQNVDKVYAINVSQQTHYTDHQGFNLDGNLQQQQYRTAVPEKMTQSQDSVMYVEAESSQHISGCAQELQNSSYFNHEPISVMKYSLHNSSAPLGRNKIFTNSAYIDHLFHDVNKDIAIANCDQYMQIINPSENDAYNALATVCYKDSKKKTQLEMQLQQQMQQQKPQTTVPAINTEIIKSTAPLSTAIPHNTRSITKEAKSSTTSAETMTMSSSAQTLPSDISMPTQSEDLTVSIEGPDKVVARRQRRSAAHT